MTGAVGFLDALYRNELVNTSQVQKGRIGGSGVGRGIRVVASVGARASFAGAQARYSGFFARISLAGDGAWGCGREGDQQGDGEERREVEGQFHYELVAESGGYGPVWGGWDCGIKREKGIYGWRGVASRGTWRERYPMLVREVCDEISFLKYGGLNGFGNVALHKHDLWQQVESLYLRPDKPLGANHYLSNVQNRRVKSNIGIRMLCSTFKESPTSA